MLRPCPTSAALTAHQVLEILGGWLRVMDGLPGADAVADLVRLAYPETMMPGLGWGDPLWMVEPKVQTVLAGWDLIARQNTPAAVAYRDGAAALRHCLERARAMAPEAA